MQKSSYRTKLNKVMRLVRQSRNRKMTKKPSTLQMPSLCQQLFQSKDDQRDFREFLVIVGVPDLNSYVEFILQVQELQYQDENVEETILAIYQQYLRPYATEKLQIGWATKTKMDMRIKNKPICIQIFDEAAVICANKIYKSLLHFYQFQKE